MRFFTEPALSQKIEILRFAQNDRRRVQDDKHDTLTIVTQPLRGEGWGEGRSFKIKENG